MVEFGFEIFFEIFSRERMVYVVEVRSNDGMTMQFRRADYKRSFISFKFQGDDRQTRRRRQIFLLIKLCRSRFCQVGYILVGFLSSKFFKRKNCFGEKRKKKCLKKRDGTNFAKFSFLDGTRIEDSLDLTKVTICFR